MITTKQKIQISFLIVFLGILPLFCAGLLFYMFFSTNIVADLWGKIIVISLIIFSISVAVKTILRLKKNWPKRFIDSTVVDDHLSVS